MGLNVGDMLSGGKETIKDKAADIATDKIGGILKDKGINVNKTDVKAAIDKGEELLEDVIKRNRK